MRWSEQVAHMGDTRNACRVSVDEARRKVTTMKTPHIVKLIILKCFFEN
jgi:hypothetical protein